MIGVAFNIVLMFFMLGLLIFVHELGHFIAAKLAGMKVEEFALGFGPSIFKFKRGETEYKLNILPIGGYVRILGQSDDGPDEITDDPRSYNNKSPLWRLIVLVSGVFMNFMLAVLIYYVLLSITGFKYELPNELKDIEPRFGEKSLVIDGEVEYVDVVKDGNALKAGFPKSGIIKKVGDKELKLSTDFSEYLAKNKNKEVPVEICVEQECETYPVKVSEKGLVGIILPPNFAHVVEYKGTSKVFAGFSHSLNSIQILFYGFSQLFSTASDSGDYEPVVNSVASPLGLYFVIDAVKQYGTAILFELTASLSLTLFVMNLLPIPALDGGRVVLLLPELLTGKAVNKKVEGYLVQFSFIFLLIFMFAIILKDIIFFDRLREMFG